MDEGEDGHTTAGVQHPDALGAVELVSGQGQQVNVLLGHVHGQVTHRLDGVGVEEHPVAAAHLPNFGDGLHRANLVVGVHDGHQTGLRGHGLLHLLGGHHAVFVDVQEGDGKALLLQGLQGVEHGVVLKGGGDDVGLALHFAKGSH